MRVLVFLLVLANLLFFAFARGYLGGGDNPDAERVRQQLQPERIHIVSKGEPAQEASGTPSDTTPSPEAAQDAVPGKGVTETSIPAASATMPESKAEEKKAEDRKAEERKAEEKRAEEKRAEEKRAEEKKAEEKKAAQQAAQQACLAWPDLPVADADRLVALANKRYPGVTLSRSTVAAEGSNNWVFIPPLPSKADAERKAGELKKLGVSEFFIVSEAGPNQYAISLGLFASEQGAKDLLEALKAKGVRSAKVGLRGGKVTNVHLEARGDATQIQGLKDSGTAITATPAACDPKAAKKP
jgi:hypothetical protein